MTKYILAACALALMVVIPRIAPAAGTAAASAPASRTIGSSGAQQPLIAASSRDLASMLVAPRDDGSDSGDDGGDDGDDDGGGE
jgi:hypothetical protein